MSEPRVSVLFGMTGKVPMFEVFASESAAVNAFAIRVVEQELRPLDLKNAPADIKAMVNETLPGAELRLAASTANGGEGYILASVPLHM